MSNAGREMTLAEWVDTLPVDHGARREFTTLEAALFERDVAGCDDCPHVATLTAKLQTAERERNEAREDRDWLAETLSHADGALDGLIPHGGKLSPQEWVQKARAAVKLAALQREPQTEGSD